MALTSTSLAEGIQSAYTENLSALQVADRLADEEKASRLRSAVDRRIGDARFPESNTVAADGVSRLAAVANPAIARHETATVVELRPGGDPAILGALWGVKDSVLCAELSSA
jgi:hypothetical protein